MRRKSILFGEQEHRGKWVSIYAIFVIESGTYMCMNYIEVLGANTGSDAHLPIRAVAVRVQ